MAFIQSFQAFFLARLDAEEVGAWRAAVAQAMRDGTLAFATPLHVAVGRKP